MGLTATLDATETDEGVEFTFEVRNDGDDPVELTFRSGQTSDVAVFDDGEEVWRWSDGMMFTQMIRQTSMGPGEKEVDRKVWESPAPGDYEAVATLEANDVDVEARTTFSV